MELEILCGEMKEKKASNKTKFSKTDAKTLTKYKELIKEGGEGDELAGLSEELRACLASEFGGERE